jgi:hypothetical protein
MCSLKKPLNNPWIGQRVNRRRRQHVCGNMYIKAEEVRQPVERRIKDKIKEIETFITTDCLTIMFFRLVFASCLIFLVL